MRIRRRPSRWPIGAALILVAAASAVPAAGAAPTVMAGYGRLPLAFAPAGDGVTYVARGPEYSVALDRGGARISVRARGRSSTLGIRFAGSSARPAVSSNARLAGTINDLVGADRSQWRRGVPTYARVVYRRVWPGIGVDFHGRGQRLEYDFRVAAGARTSVIALRFPGALRMRVERRGALRLDVGGGGVRQFRPVAYQHIGGRRRMVAVAYRIVGHQVRLRLGRYDHARPLVIDPTLSYATYFGGQGFERIGAIAVDANGDAFITGQTAAVDFPHTGAPYSSANHGDAFVTKLNPSGTALVYSTFIGGSGADSGSGIAVDAAGDAYVGGTTASLDFPVSDDAFQVANHMFSDPTDLFVAKLTPDGTGLAYATYLGGGGPESGGALALGAGGTVYVSGASASPDYPTTPGALGTTNGTGLNRIVITKLNSTGSAADYSTYTSAADIAPGIAVDAAGDAYVDGTGNQGVATTAGAFQTSAAGDADAFVQKLNPTGTALIYGTFFGASGREQSTGIAVDGSGRAYLTGATQGGIPTTPSSFAPTASSPNHLFVARFNPSGSALDYSTYLGNTTNSSGGGGGIAVDANGSAYVTGSVVGLPTTTNAAQAADAGGVDAFLAKFAPDGASLDYSTFIGGSNDDLGVDVALGPGGSVYLDGATVSQNFPVTPGALQTASGPTGFVAGYVPVDAPLRLRGTADSIACTPDPVLVGGDATCTLTVTDTDPGTKVTPSGTVSLAVAGGFGYSCTLAATATPGIASCPVTASSSTTQGGAVAVTLSYPGTAALQPSVNTSSVFHVTGGPRATTTTLMCASPSVAVRGSVNCTATVTDTGGGSPVTPTGHVALATNAVGKTTACELQAGATGSASCTTVYAPGAIGSGSHTLTATYWGETTHAISQATTPETVTAAVPVAPTESVSCSPSSVAVNRTANCSVTLTDPAGTTGPTGTVNWSTTGSATFAASCTLFPSFGSGQTVCGITYAPTAVGSGTHTVTAAYQGDPLFLAASKPVGLTVTAAVAPNATTSVVTCSPSTRAVGAKASCVVVVRDSGAADQLTPTGAVTLTSDGSGAFSPSASCPLKTTGSFGYARCFADYVPSAVGSATHTISATYAPDAQHNSSSSTFALAVTPGSGGGGTGGGGTGGDGGNGSGGAAAPGGGVGPAAPGPITGPGPGGSAAAVPVITQLKLAPSAFVVAAKHARSAKVKAGTTISYRDSLAATTTLRVIRLTTGQRVGKTCRAPSRSRKHAKSCVRAQTLSPTLKHHDVAGANKVAFTGRLGSRALARGSYRLQASAALSGHTGRTATAKFKITR